MLHHSRKTVHVVEILQIRTSGQIGAVYDPLVGVSMKQGAVVQELRGWDVMQPQTAAGRYGVVDEIDICMALREVCMS
jgi:hypothetical protein